MTRSGWFGAIVLGLMVFMALAAPWLAPGDSLDFATRPLLQPLTDTAYPLGSDQLGRDVYAMLVHGARVSLVVGAAAAAGAILIGVVVGTLAGFLGGRIDEVLMRVTEAFQTVPTFILALALVSALGPSTANVVVAIAISSWAGSARLVRAEILTLRQRDDVDAARMAGTRPLASPSPKCCPAPCIRSWRWLASPWVQPSWWRRRWHSWASRIPTRSVGAA